MSNQVIQRLHHLSKSRTVSAANRWELVRAIVDAWIAEQNCHLRPTNVKLGGLAGIMKFLSALTDSHRPKLCKRTPQHRSVVSTPRSALHSLSEERASSFVRDSRALKGSERLGFEATLTAVGQPRPLGRISVPARTKDPYTDIGGKRPGWCHSCRLSWPCFALCHEQSFAHKRVCCLGYYCYSSG
jgi:hypothetical protein